MLKTLQKLLNAKTDHIVTGQRYGTGGPLMYFLKENYFVMVLKGARNIFVLKI